MMNQKDCVYTVITALVEVDPTTPTTLTKDQRSQALQGIYELLKNDEVTISAEKIDKMTEDKHYKDYASNIFNNWLRKDTRLNGGVTYQAKNPGSRAGAGDEQVKELKKLLSTLSNPDQQAQVQAAITSRLQELKIKNTKAPEIDFSLIPEFAHLKTS